MKKFDFVLTAIVRNSFRVGEIPGSFGNRYFGLVDVEAKVNGAPQLLTLGFYRSSGTNSGKVKGQWYPIIGVKEHDGSFTEFSTFQNLILNHLNGTAKKDWLVKSIFWEKSHQQRTEVIGEDGYSHTTLAPSLRLIAEQLQTWFETNQYIDYVMIYPKLFNQTLSSNLMMKGNQHTQAELHKFYVKSMCEEILPLDTM